MKYFLSWVRFQEYVFDDHDEEGELNAKGVFFILGAGDGCLGDIGAHDFEDGGLDILIG